MSNQQKPKSIVSQPAFYEVRLEGHLGHQWHTWFEGMSMTLEDSGNTLLAGTVADQAALFGLLRKVRNLGLPLISVIRVERREE